MSDAVARPPDGFAGFSIRHRFRRVEMEAPGYEGLWAEIRTNLTHAEREDFLIEGDRIDQAWRDEVRAKSEVAKKIGAAIDDATSEKERIAAIKKREAFLAAQIRAGGDLRRKKFALVARYVRSWNVCDDQFQDVPAPAVDAGAAFEWIDDDITGWLIASCEEAYRGGPKGKSSSKPSGSAPEPTSEPPNETEKAA